MADVKFNVEAIGIPKVKSDLTSVFDLQKKHSLAVVQLHQNAEQRIREIKNDTSRFIEKLAIKEILTNKSTLQARVRAEEDAQHKITRITERESLRRSQVQAREAQGAAGGGGINVHSIGLGMQAMGFGQAGYALRAMQGIGIGGVAIAAAVTPVVLAFTELAEAAKYTTGAFLSAVSEIGNARNLQQMIVEAAANDKLGRQARLTVGANERLSDAEIDSITSRLASDVGAGGFSSNLWREGLAAYGTVSGKQRSIPFEDLRFAGMLASQTPGGTPAQALQILGTIQSQNPGMTSRQARDIMLKGVGIGQGGSFNVGQLIGPEGGELMEATSLFSAKTPMDKYAATFGIGSILKKKTGSLSTAATELKAMIQGVDRAHLEGVNYGTFKGGRIQDVNQSIAIASATNPDLRSRAMNRLEAREGLSNIAESAGASYEKDTFAQRKEKILALLEAEEGVTLTMEEFDKQNQKNIATTTRLNVIFNKLADAIEPKLLGIVTDTVIPALTKLADVLIDHKDEIASALNSLLEGVKAVIPGLISLAVIAATIAKPGIQLAITAASLPMMSNINEDKRKLVIENDILSKGKDDLGRTLTPEMIAQHKHEVDFLTHDISSNVSALDALQKLPDALDRLIQLLPGVAQAISDNKKNTDHVPGTTGDGRGK